MSIGLFWIICVIAFIAVCYFVCEWLELEEFSSRAWVYAIIGGIWGFAMKHWGGDIYDYCNSWFGKKTTATTASVYIPASSKNSSSTASIIPAPTNTQQISNLERKLQSCSYNTDVIYKGARIHYPNFCSVSHGSPNRYSYGSDFCLETWYVIHRDTGDPYYSLINGQGMRDVFQEVNDGSLRPIFIGREKMAATGKNPDGTICYIKAAVVPGTLGTYDETVVFASLNYPSNLSSSANAQLIQRIFGSFPN